MFPKSSQRDEKDDPAFQVEPRQRLNKKQYSGIPSVTKNFKSKKKEKKVKSVKGIAKSVLKEDSLDLQGSDSVCKKEEEETNIIGTENKLVTTKPWFSKFLIFNTQEESLKSLLTSEVCDSFVVCPSSKPSICSSHYIYDTTYNVNANSPLQRSFPPVNSIGGRSLHPRITEDKIRK